MAKPRKNGSSSHSNPPAAVEVIDEQIPPTPQLIPTAGDEDDGRLNRAARQLERLMGLVDERIDNGECSPAILRETTGVARAVALLSAERRSRMKTAAAIANKLSPELVMAYLRQLPHERRLHIIRELNALLDESANTVLS